MKSFFLILFLCLNATSVHSENAPPTSLQKMKLTEEEIRKNMISISKQLGVTCTECHKMKNLSDGSLKSFQVAKDHMRVVEILRQNGMNGKTGPEASCFMCHKGQLKFGYTQK